MKEKLSSENMKETGNVSALSNIFIFNNKYRFLTNFSLDSGKHFSAKKYKETLNSFTNTSTHI